MQWKAAKKEWQKVREDKRATKLSQWLFKSIWMYEFRFSENWLFTILLVRFNICFRSGFFIRFFWFCQVHVNRNMCTVCVFQRLHIIFNSLNPRPTARHPIQSVVLAFFLRCCDFLYFYYWLLPFGEFNLNAYQTKFDGTAQRSYSTTTTINGCWWWWCRRRSHIERFVEIFTVMHFMFQSMRVSNSPIYLPQNR